MAVNATGETHPDTVRALDMLGGTRVMSTHAAGSIGIGTARQDALELGLEACLVDRRADMLVVGRSASGVTECSERLRRTEEHRNHVFGLANGLAGTGIS